jgi:MtrB/PioB family decaheme-associated outer membrane protein
MRVTVLVCTAALLLTSSAARAQYGASPSQSFMTPTNPAVFGQIDFGARGSTIDGDEARYQRYRDLRDGLFVDLTGLHRETDTLVLDASARNVGWNDQRFQVGLERPGTLRFRFLYDQTPTFISRDTRTPYDPLPGDDLSASGTLTLPDSLQAAIQADPASNFRPQIEAQAGNRFFESRIRRDSLGFDVRYSHGAVDATVTYLNTGKKGDIPFGAYLQIPIEVPLPIDSRTNDVRTSLEWANAKGLLRAGWDGSWYDNQATQLVWDNPQRAVSSSTASSQGRMAEWPSNNMLSFNVGGAYRLPARTAINGVLAFGRWNQNATLLPFTINPVNAALVPLPRDTAEAKANTASVVLNFLSRPSRYFDVSARYRFYDFDNNTPPFVLARASGPDRVTADGSAGTWSDPSIGKIGTEPLGYRRNYADLDAGITGVPNTTFRVGYSRYSADTHYRVYENVGENTFRAGADIVGNQYVSFRSVYERSQRRGHDLDLLALERPEEQPGMRHYDVASRDRDRFTAVANITPVAVVSVNASVAWTRDDYLNEIAPVDSFGLQESTSKTYSAGLDVEPRDGIAAGLSFSIDDYGGLQQSRTANPGQELDPSRNWKLDEENKAWSALASLDVLRSIEKTELRLVYDYSNYRGTYGYRLPAGTTLPTPLPLPDITSTETRATVDVRYFITRRVAVGLVYWYDSYDVSDFTFSPDVVSGVAQPAVEEGQTATVNALLLNYFYRPFRAHTGWLRLTYAW